MYWPTLRKTEKHYSKESLCSVLESPSLLRFVHTRIAEGSILCLKRLTQRLKVKLQHSTRRPEMRDNRQESPTSVQVRPLSGHLKQMNAQLRMKKRLRG